MVRRLHTTKQPHGCILSVTTCMGLDNIVSRKMMVESGVGADVLHKRMVTPPQPERAIHVTG